MDKKTIVLGVIGSDVHAVGNKILDYALTDAGFNVVNIGVLSMQQLKQTQMQYLFLHFMDMARLTVEV